MFVHTHRPMFPRRAARRLSLVIAALVVVTTAAVQAQDHRGASRRRAPEPVVFSVDVAEDLTGKFVATHVLPEHTEPKRGSFYVTEGRVFPAGTIQGDGATFDPNRSGHIGVWIGRGTHLVAASDIPAAHWWAHTAQLFVLGRQAKDQIASDGIEGRGTLVRIVSGGTGGYAGYVGEQRQTFLGFNTTGGVNLRVTFTLHPIAD